MSLLSKNIKQDIDEGFAIAIKDITDRLEMDWRFVGGCIRDRFLNLFTDDIDICTLALPDEIERCLQGFNLITIGKTFGTIGVFYKNFQIEITTTRRDVTTYGRKADVMFTNSFIDDSLRRDFTINALMFRDRLYDYHNGLEHLEKKKVIFIGSPHDRIMEDYLRIVRYVRFQARFGSVILYKDIIKEHFEGLKKVSIERIISEIIKMLRKENSKYAIELLNDFELSKFLFKKDLYNNIQENFTVFENLAILFSNNDILPTYLPKNTNNLLSMRRFKYESQVLNLVMLWQHYKDIHILERFLFIQNYFFSPINYDPYLINLLQKPLNKPNLECFIGKERYYAEVAVKWQHFTNSTFIDALNFIKKNI